MNRGTHAGERDKRHVHLKMQKIIYEPKVTHPDSWVAVGWYDLRTRQSRAELERTLGLRPNGAGQQTENQQLRFSRIYGL